MIHIKKIAIQGIKGILKEKDIPFNGGSEKYSCAIFAPNATGKSGIADAVEYFFSLEGEVEHLGKRSDTEKGGKISLVNVKAKKHNIEPKLNISFYDEQQKTSSAVERIVASGIKDPAPTEVQQLIEKSPAHRILRQHDLRQFVVDKGPNEKYDQIAKWIGFEAIRKVQDDLKTAENDFSNYNFDNQIEERKNDLTTATNNIVVDYDTVKIEDWINTELGPKILPCFQRIKFNQIDDTVKQINELYDDSFKKLGGGDLSNLSSNISLLLKTPSKSDETSKKDEEVLGSLYDLVKKFEKLEELKIKFEEGKNNVKDYIFESVWQSAKELIESNKGIGNCPVCGTSLDQTIHKDAITLYKHIEEHLSTLKKVKEIENELKQSLFQAHGALKNVRNKIISISTSPDELNIENTLDEIDLWSEFKKSIDFSTDGERNKHLYEIIDICKPASVELLRNQLKLLSGEIYKKLYKIEEETKKYKDASKKLQDISEGHQRVQVLKKQNLIASKLLQNFQKIVSAYNKKTTEFLNEIINDLELDINNIFGKIHGNSFVPKIYFKLSPDKDKAIDMMVDFHSHNNPVKPAGYLSESYINTLGIAIFLSSVKRFNREFPFIMLDDVVSSYDAEHRAKIARVIVEDYTDFQILLTTHDRAFFQCIRETARGEKWQFMKFKGWSIESGPEIENEYTTDSDIENALKDKSNPGVAGNLVRQAIEEWFDKKCDVFQAKTIHKSGERNVKRELNELYPSLEKRMKELGDSIKNWYEKNQSVQRLSASTIFGNLLSHNQSDPYVWSSIGDAELLWHDFKSYRQLFACKNCRNELVYTKEFSKIICKKTGCDGTLP